MIIRIFDTSVNPEDVDKATDLFKQKVETAFEQFPGCHGIELLIGVEEHSRDLAEFAAISRWDSMEAIDRAVHTAEYDDALVELKQLFQSAPIVRHFRTN
jgi:quinol monooxygenase YgiN